MEEEIEKTKKEIRKTLEEKGKQIIFNARVKNLEEDEKCSKYFFEKIIGKKHEMKKIEGESSTSGKLNKVKSFYDDLFNKKKIDESLAEFFIQNLDKKLNKNEQEFLTQDFSLEEILTVIKSFDSSKTPGNDGLLVEFYKCFWEILKEVFLQIIERVS